VFRARLSGRSDAETTVTVSATVGEYPQAVLVTCGPAGQDAADGAPRPYGTWKWVAAGGAAVALVSGLYLLATDGNGIDCPPGPGQCPEHYENTAGGVGLTVAGAALGGVATWMFLQDRARPESGLGAKTTAGGALLYFRRTF